MKINDEIKYRSLASHVREQLSFIPVDEVKSSILIFVLAIYDVPFLWGLSYILELEFLWIVSPFILVIHLWGGRLLFKNPYSSQLEMILYMGVWGVLGAISLFITVLGLMFYTFHISSVFSYLIIIVATIISAYILIKYQINKYAGDPTKERKEKNQTEYMWLLSASPGLGYLLIQSFKEMDVIKHVIAVVAIYLFMIFFVYAGAKFLHRYFFIKANMEYIKYQPLTAKERNKVLKQGVEIK